jgi:hypothetical protein
MSNPDQKKTVFPNHKRLLRIAKFSDYFSWIAFVYYVCLAILNVLTAVHDDPIRYGSTISSLLLEKQFYAILLLANTLRIVLQAIIIWLILKGVSLGLIMIVETNHNSILGFGGETHAQ